MEHVKWSKRHPSLHANDCPCRECAVYWAGDAYLASKLEQELEQLVEAGGVLPGHWPLSAQDGEGAESTTWAPSY